MGFSSLLKGRCVGGPKLKSACDDEDLLRRGADLPRAYSGSSVLTVFAGGGGARRACCSGCVAGLAMLIRIRTTLPCGAYEKRSGCMGVVSRLEVGFDMTPNVCGAGFDGADAFCPGSAKPSSGAADDCW